MWLVFYTCIQTSRDFPLCLPKWMCQNETSDRPGHVSLKVQSANQRRGSRGRWKQPVLSATPERGRREDMEIYIDAVFSTINHWYIILGGPIPQIKSQKGVKYGPFKASLQYTQAQIENTTGRKQGTQNSPATHSLSKWKQYQTKTKEWKKPLDLHNHSMRVNRIISGISDQYLREIQDRQKKWLLILRQHGEKGMELYWLWINFT